MKTLKVTQRVKSLNIKSDFDFQTIENEIIDKVMKIQKDAVKYHNPKEVIQNMIDRLDEGSEMTLTKDSVIVLALKEAIK